MKPLHVNPYVFSADEESALFRQRIVEKLESWYVRSRYPSCASIIGERGSGTLPAVRHFLAEYKDKLPLRFVTCDVDADLRPPRGARSAADFYRSFVKHVADQLTDIPTAQQFADRLVGRMSQDLADIEDDLFDFFREVRKANTQLLVVFLNFDVLPRRYSFEGRDWLFLRELHNRLEVRVIYLIVTRRSLGHVEQTNDLRDSNFAALFLAFLRVGPLSDDELRQLLAVTQGAVQDAVPWPNWLVGAIRQWGGRHLQCTEYLCYELFDRLYNQRLSLVEDNLPNLKQEMRLGLAAFFDRLYQSLARDELAETLVRVISMGIAASDIEQRQLQELCDLGYLYDDPGQSGKKVLFSPLFHDYLVHSGALPSTTFIDSGIPLLRQPRPAVQRILDLQQPSEDIRMWFASELQHSRRLQPKETDKYVLLYLTGCERNLTEPDLNLLRYWLTERYRHDCAGHGDRRGVDAIRSTFHAECKRWRARYHNG